MALYYNIQHVCSNYLCKYGSVLELAIWLK
jgi:hypothetical protein